MMIPVAWKMVLREKTRFIITASGVGFTVVLMLFQLGVYQGVKSGATGYVKESPSEIWICEANSTNLIRSSSFLSTTVGESIEATKGVAGVTGILRVLITTRINKKSVTLLLFGFDPDSELGTPSLLIKGHSNIRSGEMVVDRAFASKYKLALGDSLQIKGQNFKISGICEGTNAIAAQFVFVTLEDAQNLIGFSNLVSFFLLQGYKQTDTRELTYTLKQSFPTLAVYSKEEFIQNNIDELKSGVLPVLWIIAFFGGILGAAIITIMLYSSVLEKRESFALLKAIGATQKFMVLLVVKQSIFGATTGFLFGLGFYLVLSPLIMKLIPEISLSHTWSAPFIVLAISLLMGTAGSLMPVHKMSKIYPMEVFK